MKQEEQLESIQHLVMAFMQYIILPFEKCMGLQLSVMQFRALCCLAMSRNQKMTELAEHLCISKQQVTQIVDRMTEMGFLRRVEDTHDRRCIRVDLTEFANQYLNEKLSDYATVFCYDLRNLSKAQQKKFWTAVEYIMDILPQMSGLAESAEDVFQSE